MSLLRVVVTTEVDGVVTSHDLAEIVLPTRLVKAPLSEHTTGQLLDELRDRWTRENLELY